MPVRDALQHLQSTGALVARPSGTLIVPMLTAGELQTLNEIRFALESLAVGRAAVNVTPADGAALRHQLDQVEAARQESPAVYRRSIGTCTG